MVVFHAGGSRQKETGVGKQPGLSLLVFLPHSIVNRSCADASWKLCSSWPPPLLSSPCGLGGNRSESKIAACACTSTHCVTQLDIDRIIDDAVDHSRKQKAYTHYVDWRGRGGIVVLTRTRRHHTEEITLRQGWLPSGDTTFPSGCGVDQPLRSRLFPQGQAADHVWVPAKGAVRRSDHWLKVQVERVPGSTRARAHTHARARARTHTHTQCC